MTMSPKMVENNTEVKIGYVSKYRCEVTTPTLKIFWFAVYRLTQKVFWSVCFCFYYEQFSIKIMSFSWTESKKKKKKKKNYLPTHPENSGWVNSKHIFKVGPI